MVRICFLIPSLQSGGMERAMSELLNQFVKDSNLEIHLVLFGINREIFYKISNLAHIHIPKFSFNNKYRLYYTLKSLFYLRKEIIKLKPFTILSFGEYWNSFVLLSLLGLKYPIYISDRCQPNKSFGMLQELLRKLLYPRAKGIIAQTNTAKEIYRQNKYNNNIKVIGNPIRQIDNNSDAIVKQNIVLSVGRLIKTKHHSELIKLFSEINKPDWKLVIVGDDAQKQNNKSKLLEQISKLKMENRIILSGKRNDVDEYYLISKIFAFTSSSEGFPNVIGEALSAGLPVITFDCIAGPSEMIEDGKNGFLVPLFNYELFKIKLSLLMNNEDLRNKLGKHGNESIKRFSNDIIAEKYYDFITK